MLGRSGYRKESDLEENRLYGVREVAFFLNVHRNTVFKLVKTGQLPCITVGNSFKFFKPDIAKYLDGQRKEAAGKFPAS